VLNLLQDDPTVYAREGSIKALSTEQQDIALTLE